MIQKITSNIISKNEELFRIFRQDTKLPKPPSDIEKYIYGNGEFRLYSIVAIVTSAIACYGQVIWILADKDRYPFFLSVAIFALFSVITYITAFFKKSFNQNKHDDLNKRYFHRSETKIYPSVDIYLATCGEDLEVLENAYNYVSKLNWLGDIYVYVLDDKGSKDVESLAGNYNFRYIHRPIPGELKKAGNIRYAFSQTDGDYFVIFDADFCPRSDFLTETLPYFAADPRLGLLQTPQYFHLTKNSNFIEIGSTAKEEFFYRCIQPARDIFNGSMCVGTNAIYKREACEKMGGLYPLEHSEDIHTGFALLNDGWKLKYIPLVLAKGMAPDNINAYFSQQYRWGLGTLMQIFDHKFWFAKIPLFIKINYINAIFYYINVATGIVLNPVTVLLTVMFFPEQIKFYEIIWFAPYFVFQYIYHPIWQKSPWSIKCISANQIANTSYLFALFDLITGSTMDWIPTGQIGKKSGKKSRYHQFLTFVILWHIITYSLIFYFSIMNMQSWDDYNFYPIIFLSIFNILITIAMFEPLIKLKQISDKILNLLGLKVFITQLRSVSSILFLVGILVAVTSFAINKEGRAYIINTISSFSIDKATQNGIIPIPVLSIKNIKEDENIKKSLESNQSALSNPKSTIEQEKKKTEIETESKLNTPITTPINSIPKTTDPKPTPEIKPPTLTPSPELKKNIITPTNPTQPNTPKDPIPPTTPAVPPQPTPPVVQPKPITPQPITPSPSNPPSEVAPNPEPITDTPPPLGSGVPIGN